MQPINYASAITLAIAGFTGYAIPAQAQPTDPVNNLPSNLQVRFAQLKPDKVAKQPRRARRVWFILPRFPTTGAPGNRQGAGSRSNCLAVDPKLLTALVPEIKHLGRGQGEAIAVTHVWGLTVAEYPTFWFYVPNSHISASSGEFVLEDANNIYQTSITLPEKPGIVSFRLPSTSAPLEVGKLYHWYFVIDCNQQNTSKPIFVEGWVQRVVPNSTLKSQLATATPQQQIALYAENGIWYEALTSLAELRLANPQDASLTADWADLLQSIGLSEIASKPVVQCCMSENSSSVGSSQKLRVPEATEP